LIPSLAGIALSSKSRIGGGPWFVLAGRRQRWHDQGMLLFWTELVVLK
jgi:hypothetical protein